MSNYSLQSYFTPNENALNSLSQHDYNNIAGAYNNIGNAFCSILRQEYGAHKINICIAPVNENRVIMRVNEMTDKGENITGAFNCPVQKFINHLIDKREEEEIYVAKDQDGHNVISFRADEMIPFLKDFVTRYDRAQQYLREINIAEIYYKETLSAPARTLN